MLYSVPRPILNVASSLCPSHFMYATQYGWGIMMDHDIECELLEAPGNTDV